MDILVGALLLLHINYTDGNIIALKQEVALLRQEAISNEIQAVEIEYYKEKNKEIVKGLNFKYNKKEVKLEI